MYAYASVGGILAMSLILYLATTLTRNYYRLPRSFPGPFFASISEIWLVYQSVTCKLQGSCFDLLQKHGSVVRIGPNTLVTDDLELLRHMSMIKSRWTRGGWYDAFELGGPLRNVLSERDEKRHKELRSKLGLAYSGKGVDNLELCIDNQTKDLIKLLREQYARPGRVFDLTRVTYYYTLDVLSSIAFCTPFGFLRENTDKWDYVSGNELFIPFIDVLTHNATIRAIFQHPIMQKLLGPKESDEVGVGRVMRFASEAIDAHFAADEKDQVSGRRDFLAAFRASGLSIEQCKSESLVQILAGTDSTSNHIRNTMLHVVTNPRIYNALQREVDEAVATGKVVEGEIISDAQARRLPYLQAVIWEGLRKNPPLLGFGNKLAPSEGEQVGDIFFPPGVEVGICATAATHRKDVFGPDVQLFRPERWLEADTEMLAKYQRTTELVFGTGRYSCLGRNIAWMELEKALFELIRHFDWQIVDPIRPVKLHRVSASVLQKGMDMVVKERQRQS